ncbi:hypothetical protein Bca52824_031304 [Brassica carinata]|uniref:Uncharacterized protein n=1 Tax=Brassica carinata TaxID=52824 RepID=A0A8X7SAG3_BRACI|nr:hypothetical protein Bca52824_031304 [Brassica carinata]
MNAVKFVVLLIFVGLVCANVGARQLEEVIQKLPCANIGTDKSNKDQKTTNFTAFIFDISLFFLIK